MQVIVIFDFPDCRDVNGERADFILDALSEELEGLGHEWWIEDAVGNINKDS